MHIYEGVIQLNMQSRSAPILNMSQRQKKAVFLQTMQPLLVLRPNTAEGIQLKNDIWLT